MTDHRQADLDGARPSRPSGSPPRTRHDARRQYLSLGAGELTSVATFTMLGVWAVPTILTTGMDLAAFWLALGVRRWRTPRLITDLRQAAPR